LRATLLDLFAQAKKNNVAFAEYVYQRIETIQGRTDPKAQTGDRKKKKGRR
jgi:murein L,D-transpeptidase YafK